MQLAMEFYLSYGGVVSTVVGMRRRRQCILGPLEDPPLPLPVGLHQSRLEQGLGVGLELADELERGRPHQGLPGRRVQQRRARDVPSLHGDLVRDSPAEAAKSTHQSLQITTTEL